MQRRQHIGEVARYLVDARALTRFHYADESPSPAELAAEKPVHHRHFECVGGNDLLTRIHV